MDGIRVLTHAHHDVIWLEVSVNQTFTMHVLETLQDLIEQHQRGLRREFSAAKIEQVLQCRTEQLRDHVDLVFFHTDALVNQLWISFAGEVLKMLEFI